MTRLNKNYLVALFIFIFGFLILFKSTLVYAVNCDDGTKIPDAVVAEDGNTAEKEFCGSRGFGGSSTGGAPANNTGQSSQEGITRNREEFVCEDGDKLDECINKNPVVNTLRLIVNFLSVGVGIVVVAMIVVAGIQFASSGEDPEKAAKAKRKIINTLIALFAYIFLGAFLQWVIPGGLF